MKFESWWTEEKYRRLRYEYATTGISNQELWTKVLRLAYDEGFKEGAEQNNNPFKEDTAKNHRTS